MIVLIITWLIAGTTVAIAGCIHASLPMIIVGAFFLTIAGIIAFWELVYDQSSS